MDRDCKNCIYKTDDGCTKWDCEYINRGEIVAELEKANATIKELQELNEELAREFYDRKYLWNKIETLGDYLDHEQKRNGELAWKLANRKAVLKEALKEALYEVIDELKGRLE